jgi:arabinan endo-1,5-alpha-L-arabinosidase
VVGRSSTLLGPYVDKAGTDMKNNGYEVVIGPNERFVGNGHCSKIIRDDAGDDWIFYHGVDKTSPEGRRLLLDKVEWVDEWPVVNDGTPSLSAKKPHFET